MYYVSHLFYGFTVAFVAVILPGMVNMTSVIVSIKRGLGPGLSYSFGAALTMGLQALVAVAFAHYLTEHPEVITFLKKAAVIIFLALSIVFLHQAMKPKALKASNRRGRPILLGLLVAAMNALTIPYFFAISTFMESKGWIGLGEPQRYFFVIGAFLGGLTLLSGYARFAQFISRHANYFARNLNYFLSGLFLVLACLQIAQLYG